MGLVIPVLDSLTMIYLAFTGSMIFLDTTMLQIRYSKSTKFDDIGRSISNSRFCCAAGGYDNSRSGLPDYDLLSVHGSYIFLDFGMLLTGYLKS